MEDQLRLRSLHPKEDEEARQLKKDIEGRDHPVTAQIEPVEGIDPVKGQEKAADTGQKSQTAAGELVHWLFPFLSVEGGPAPPKSDRSSDRPIHPCNRPPSRIADGISTRRIQLMSSLADKGWPKKSLPPSQGTSAKGNTGKMRKGQAANSWVVPLFLGFTVGAAAVAPEPDQSSVIQGIDQAVLFRVNHIAGYTVSEHYAVFRGKDETHPISEMTVRTTYRRESGKSYQVVSSSGSAIVRRLGLDPILESERTINLPGNVAHSWITSANYEMALFPGRQELDGRDCYVLAIHPRQKAPNLIEGRLWVDASDYTIVRLEGTASKSPSVFAGVTRMSRQYADIDGFAMATHARAESTTFLYGRTVVKIDYSGYQIERQSGH